MIPPTPRLRPVPLPTVPSIPGHPPPWSYPGELPSPATPTVTSPVVQLNPMLKPSLTSWGYYDVARPPSSIIFEPSHSPFALNEHATTPPVASLRILIPMTPPWPVIVHNGHGVTVFDVFEAIYHALRTPESPSVWDVELSLPPVASLPPRPLRAHSHGLPYTPSILASSLKGKRKVDRLHGRTTFAGLKKKRAGNLEPRHIRTYTLSLTS